MSGASLPRDAVMRCYSRAPTSTRRTSTHRSDSPSKAPFRALPHDNQLLADRARQFPSAITPSKRRRLRRQCMRGSLRLDGTFFLPRLAMSVARGAGQGHTPPLDKPERVLRVENCGLAGAGRRKRVESRGLAGERQVAVVRRRQQPPCAPVRSAARGLTSCCWRKASCSLRCVSVSPLCAARPTRCLSACFASANCFHAARPPPVAGKP